MTNWRLGLFVFANIGITLGYLVIGLFLLPRVTEFVRRLVPFIKINLTWTGLGGLVFFTTCGLTHLEMAIHVYFYGSETNRQSMLAWHSIVIHDVQVVAVWMLILGTIFEFALPVTRAISSREKS
jgi:hypothetical protein